MSLRRLFVPATLLVFLMVTSGMSFAATTATCSVDLCTANTSAPATPAKSVVTIMAAQKTFNAEGSVTVAKIGERAKLQNFQGEIHVVIENLDSKPQTATVRFQELQEPAYDLYVDKIRIRSAKREELAAGIPLKLPEGYGYEYLPFFRQMATSIKALLGSFRTSENVSTATAGTALSLTLSGCTSAELDFQQSRASYVILVPADRAMSRTPPYSTLTSEQAAQRMNNRLNDLVAKRTVLSRVQDESLRNRSLAAVTPLQFAVVVSEPDAKGVRQVSCTVTNESEIPLSGQIQLIPPTGWTKTQPLDLKSINPGEAGKVTFKVNAPASSTGLKARATIRAGNASFETYAVVKP